MKKILYIILNGEEYGGSEKHVVDLINNLGNQYEIELIMSKGNSMYNDIQKGKCKQIYMIDRNSLFSLLNIRKIIKKFSPDIIHAHAARGIVMGRLFYKYTKNKNIKLICTAHGWVLDYLKFKKVKEKLLLHNRNLDAVTLAVSNFSMQEMIQHGYSPQKMKYVYNGIDVEKFNKNATIKDDVKNVNFIGRFTDQKGINYLMEAINRLKNEQINFNIYGKGEKKDYICSKICENNLFNTKLHDFIKADKVKDVLKQTDILILPSIDEGLPYILVEAISSGVPCIATNVGGVSEIIDDNVGRLIESKNVDKIVEKVLELKKIGLKKLSSNCILKSQKFDVKKMIKNINEIYLEVLNEKK